MSFKYDAYLMILIRRIFKSFIIIIIIIEKIKIWPIHLSVTNLYKC
jgi:hypothetical protein